MYDGGKSILCFIGQYLLDMIYVLNVVFDLPPKEVVLISRYSRT